MERHLDVAVEAGLSSDQVAERQRQYGLNELADRGRKNPLAIFWDQITNPLVLLLLGAVVISFALNKIIDGAAVLAIVILNAILGFVQEYRAEQAMAALKRLSSPVVRVRRAGRVEEVPASQVVPGDVILIEAGNNIPADARLVETANLQVQEAALTGESHPVEKTPQMLPEEGLPLGDRRNMVYMGTAATYGRGTAVVVQTGMSTELGRIAELIQGVKPEPTPLQRRIAGLGRALAIAVLLIVAVAFAAGLLRGEEAVFMFQTAISMAVAAVPEGLPAVVTIVLALGAQRMLKRSALIRKLPAVETLGSVTTICSDKTGTLTENRMTVTILDVPEHTLSMDEVLEHGKPIFLAGEEPLKTSWPAHALLAAAGALCNDAVIQQAGGTGPEYTAIGDPTEGALVVAAARLGLWKPRLEKLFPRLAEVPFSSERRRMSTLHRADLTPSISEVENPIAGLFSTETPWVLFVKGGVDSLLDVCDRVWVDGRILPMTGAWRERIENANNRLAAGGLRVLGVAFRPIHVNEHRGEDTPELTSGIRRIQLESGELAIRMPVIQMDEAAERELILIGLVGMMDPPRAEVKDAVAVSLAAGIRPVMITGDQPLTALQIARMLHIAAPDQTRVLTGQELARLSDGELEAVVEEVPVYARVSPEHKLRIVQALQRRGHVVAMTGDGVNDAPALRRSDIGVAMGITGTDVSKEAASMVILDDNFATIVSAVEEGRRVYENVRKFIRYTLGSNAGEILVMFFAPFLGMPLPLTPLQILWMNLITDGFPGLALTSEQPERDIMQRPPVNPRESIFSRGVGSYILRIGVVMAAITLLFGYLTWRSGNPAWETMLFSLLIFLQGGHALAIRSQRESLFRLNPRSNPSVYLAVLLTVLLQLAAVYWPPLQKLFGTVSLSGQDLLVTLLAGCSLLVWVELEKAWTRRRNP